MAAQGILPRAQLAARGQTAIDDEVGDFGESGRLGQALDGVATVAEDAWRDGDTVEGWTERDGGGGDGDGCGGLEEKRRGPFPACLSLSRALSLSL